MNIIAYYLGQVLFIYSWILIIYILMSWFPNAQNSSIGRFLASICEPYLEPFRKIIPPLGMIDLSPIVAFLVLRFASQGIYFVASMF